MGDSREACLLRHLATASCDHEIARLQRDIVAFVTDPGQRGAPIETLRELTKRLQCLRDRRTRSMVNLGDGAVRYCFMPVRSPATGCDESAHRAVAQAVKDGRLSKAEHCQACGALSNIVGHHEDYGQPLDVVWLCQPCHARVHAGHDIFVLEAQP